MKLKKLLEQLDYTVLQGSDEAEIKTLTDRTQDIGEQAVFLCIKGMECDGHCFVMKAVRKGAVALIVEREVEVPNHVTVIKVPNTRCALARMSAAYYHYPAEKLKIIGVTGTKGKTTTAYMIRAMLEGAGHHVGLIGTIETIIGEQVITAKNTTPESLEIQRYFKNMVDAGCDFVVMEVSSQGLKMFRTEGIQFEVGVFTNLGEDHIGANEHASFEEYKQCKKMLFRQCKIGIGNRDDPYFEEIFQGATCHVESYGFSEEATLRASKLKQLKNLNKLGVSFRVSGSVHADMEIGIPGRYSVYNALATIAVCSHFQVNERLISEILKTVTVKGRNEIVPISDSYILMIDFAHNAMSLENLLTTLREYHPKRLVCLFGCGGNRSKVRRYEMGEVSGRLADITIVTSDNPRYEDPQAIIDDIKIGLERSRGTFVEQIDRRKAIRYAIETAQAGDVIVLAGKGHEDYQEIKGQKYDMDEREIIAQIIDEKKC